MPPPKKRSNHGNSRKNSLTYGPEFAVSEKEDVIIISDKKFCDRGMQALYKFQQDGLLCDVTLTTNGVRIPAHRVVLSASSDYFRAMFTLGMEETKQEEIHMEDISALVMQTLVNYLYTGTLHVPLQYTQEVMVAGDMLQLTGIKDALAKMVVQHITEANCLGLYELGQRLCCQLLVDKARLVVEDRYQLVCRHDEFSSLTQNALVDVLSLPGLKTGVGGEDLILHSVIRWLQVDPMARVKLLPPVLKSIKWSKVTKACFQKLLEIPTISEDSDTVALIQSLSCSSSGEPSRSPHLRIYVLGGYLQSRTGPMCPRLHHVEWYNITADCWEQVADLQTEASVIQTFNIAGKLITSLWQYCHTDVSRLDKSEQSLFEYNPCRNKWEPYNGASPEVINLLHRCATNQGAVTYCEKHHRLYIVDSEAVSCVQVDISNGDVNMQTVTSYPLVPSFQEDTYVNVAATVLDGSLIVLGGTLVVSELEKFSKKDVWMFDEGNHCWVKKNGMLYPRAAFCAVTFNSMIYVMGGFNQKRMKSVERYDIHSDTWCEVSTMNKERTHAAAVVAGDKIYIFGGKSYSDSYACGGASDKF